MNLNVIFFQGMFLLHLNIDLESAAFWGWFSEHVEDVEGHYFFKKWSTSCLRDKNMFHAVIPGGLGEVL